MLTNLLTVLKAKLIPILLVTTSVASAGIAVFVTNFIWESKYTKLELTVERDKSAEIARVHAAQATAYEKVITNYNATVAEVTHIIETRDAAVEASSQKYRSLYAAYSRLQQSAPSDIKCRIPAPRTDLLLQSVDQANESRRKFFPTTTESNSGTR